MDEKLDELLFRWVEGELTPSEVEELCARLEEGSAARSRAVDLLMVDSQLAELFRRWNQNEQRTTSGPSDRSTRRSSGRPGWQRPWRFAKLIIAASLAGLLASGFALWRRFHEESPRPGHTTVVAPAQKTRGDAPFRDRSAVPEPALPDPAPRRGEGEVASLVEARNILWAEGQVPLAVGARLRPGEIRCREGTLKLVFDAGALVVLEGPAELNVLSGMRIRALRGRITARVEPGAKGFAIETPSTVVVDQGTEFGVEVDASGRTGVVVFEGLVNLSGPETDPRPTPIKQLSQGEALRVGRSGDLSRIIAVERRPGDDEWSTGPSEDRDAVIRSVRDNIRGLDSSKYYQIVHRGLDDDVPAYVDRHHQWNGLDPSGLPRFLRGADYIMPFNEDKRRKDLQVTVEVACSATLYIFHDDRSETPPWLATQFTDTGIDIGLDEGPVPDANQATDRGPGRSIDHVFSVWSRDLGQGESIELGALTTGYSRAMYGIAAVPRP